MEYAATTESVVVFDRALAADEVREMCQQLSRQPSQDRGEVASEWKHESFPIRDCPSVG